MNTSVRREFEEAFKDHPFLGATDIEFAFWGARWAMERCADLCVSEEVDDHASGFLEKKIRQLAKELDES